MNRTLLRTIARWLIAALLGVQFAVAAYACPALAQATSSAGDEPAAAMIEMPAMADCGDVLGAVDPLLPNLCAAHCEADQQSSHSASVAVPPAIPVPLYELAPPLLLGWLERPAAASPSALVAGAPPHAILHCVRRT
ncbi:hypothetical protein [Piscinibacter sakaiensis]|uniref:hypothetical protein n=1 Tax=Piscinibacter sakaiensis TaxID=1547922 RepID=UPI003AAB525E